MNYIPRLWHAVALMLLGCALMLGGVWSGWFVVAGSGILVTFAWVLVLLVAEQRDEHIRTVTEYGRMLATLNADQWSALGIAFPSQRIKFLGAPIKFWEDTNVQMWQFERFMRESDERQISPERNWNSGPDRRAWREIQGWLERGNYIYVNSAAGSHSWLWRPGMFRVLWQRYMPAVADVPDLTAMEDGRARYLQSDTQLEQL